MLKDANRESTEFRKALQLANRCLEKFVYTSTKAEQELEDKSRRSIRNHGAGRKSTALEVRQAAFQWFQPILLLHFKDFSTLLLLTRSQGLRFLEVKHFACNPFEVPHTAGRSEPPKDKMTYPLLNNNYNKEFL